MDKNNLNALIIFVDIRGFSSWAEKIGNIAFLDIFVEEWYKVLGKNFSYSSLIKHLGDGAMIIQEIKEKTTAKLLRTLLAETLKNINACDKEFSRLCKKFSEEEGTKIPLVLGWGIAKGPIRRINGDYIGADINKCSRYCDIARPYGIVIDADDFQNLPVLPKNIARSFSKQTRLLTGIYEEAEVWVTKEIAEQFIPRESLRESPEVHIAGVCFKKEKGIYFILLGQRTKNRKLYPLLYEGCGGQLLAGFPQDIHDGEPVRPVRR